jgi:hypothetical protein
VERTAALTGAQLALGHLGGRPGTGSVDEHVAAQRAIVGVETCQVGVDEFDGSELALGDELAEASG